MDQNDFVRFVEKDVLQEQRQTLLAALFGWTLGIAVVIGPLTVFLLSKQYVNVLFYILFLIFLAPVYIAQMQKTMKDRGNSGLAEFIGYFGFGVACLL